MSSVKRTISLPAELSEQLDQEVPDRQRSKFIASSLEKALRSQRKAKLLKLLETYPRNKQVDGRKSEDLFRELRDNRAQEIIDNS